MASLPLDAMDSSALPDGWMYADLDASDILLEYAQIIQPPYLVAGVGLAIGVLFTRNYFFNYNFSSYFMVN